MPDYMRFAGEVLAKTGSGAKAFDAYCGMLRVVTAYGRPEEARQEMEKALSAVFPLTVENCTRAFEQELFKAGYDKWVAL